jgi:hypothetical protein
MKNFIPDWSLPDQLAYTTVSSLLKLAAVHSEYRDDVMTAITTFTSVLVTKLQDSPREFPQIFTGPVSQSLVQPLKYLPIMRSRFMVYTVPSFPPSSLGAIIAGLQSLNTLVSSMNLVLSSV